MSYIVGATPSRGKHRIYFGDSGAKHTRVAAKASPISNHKLAKRCAAKLESAERYDNIQVIRCEGWGRPAKKRRATRR